MPTCASCGEESPARAKFCLACGLPLEVPSTAAESRKVVSMIFCDVEGSTALAERMDPEALNHVLTRWVAAMRTAIEWHEGKFVEFRGDSILGVFGIPVLHEDDAVRAVRAAVDMRDALASLNAELASDLGIALAVRTGINTGEVLIGPEAGTGLVVGDPVNLAARLEQAAAAGEILVGEATADLVDPMVDLEALPPFEVKGKREPVKAFRVLGMRDRGATRPGCLMDAELVGRADEQARLSLLVERIRKERSCRGALVSGNAGIGKTRLVEEFLSAAAGECLVASGVCRSYGAGAYAPASELIRNVLGLRDEDDAEAARARIVAVLASADADTQAGHLLQMLGLADGSAPPEELAASTRRLVEMVARGRPTVLFVDDVQWAASPMVDLIEHLLRWVRDAPVLVLCTARPEFADAHPTWMSDRALGVLDIDLQPLSSIESEALVEGLLGESRLPPRVRDRVSEAAEGNPLFLEQLLAMLVDDGVLVERDGRWVAAGDVDDLRVPPSIHALLAARLDRLAPDERGVIERGAVVGRTFYWHAVEELSAPPARGGVGGHLMSLVRRDLIRPDRSGLVGQDAFSFHHVLIRDTTYGAIPKGSRAELHEAFSAWLEGTATDAIGDLDESVGFHLERACSLRRELGHHDDRTRALGVRASELLARAGYRAARRGQDATAVDLLARALVQAPDDDPARPAILLGLAEAEYAVGAFAESADHVEDLLHSTSLDEGASTRAEVLAANLKFQLDPDGVLEDTRRTSSRLLPGAERRSDDRALAMLYRLLARADLWAGDTAAMTANAERAVELAERSGDGRERDESAVMLCWALHLGDAPIDDVVTRLRALAEATGDNRRVQAVMLAHLAPAVALGGRADEGRELRARAIAQFRDLGLEVQAAIATQSSAGSLLPAVAAARARDAEADLRWGCEVLSHAEERGFLASVTGMLAEAVLDAGAVDEARSLVDRCRAIASDDDADAQQRWRLVSAKILARNGMEREAIALLAEVEGRPPTFPAWSGFVAADVAEILALAGRAEEAGDRLEEARRRFGTKGIVAASSRLDAVAALIGA